MSPTLLGVALAVGATALGGGPPPPERSFQARVVYVSDGDTFGIASARRGVVPVRIIGVDTPETKDPDRPVECFGRQASRRLRQLIGGSVVTLAFQPERTDRYGRDLLDVWTPSGRFVAGSLVRGGYGRALEIPPTPDMRPAWRLPNGGHAPPGGACGDGAEPDRALLLIPSIDERLGVVLHHLGHEGCRSVDPYPGQEIGGTQLATGCALGADRHRGVRQQHIEQGSQIGGQRQ